MSRSGAGEFEDDGEGDCPDGDESEVFGCEVEQDVEGDGGFFVHGGSEFGSAGCIDLQKNDKAFHDYLQQINQSSLFILVNYAKEKVTIRENKTNLIPFVPKMD